MLRFSSLADEKLIPKNSPADVHFEREGAQRFWFEASVGLLERLRHSLGEEERSDCFELCGRFYRPSNVDDDDDARVNQKMSHIYSAIDQRLSNH